MIIFLNKSKYFIYYWFEMLTPYATILSLMEKQSWNMIPLSFIDSLFWKCLNVGVFCVFLAHITLALLKICFGRILLLCLLSATPNNSASFLKSPDFVSTPPAKAWGAFSYTSWNSHSFAGTSIWCYSSQREFRATEASLLLKRKVKELSTVEHCCVSDVMP